MKIILLAPQPYYQDRGTPIDVDLLVRALVARGEHVDLVTYHEGENRTYPHVTHHRIRAPRWLNDIGPGFSLRKLICDGLLFLLAWKLMRRTRYDVIHAGEEAVFMAMILKALFGIPYVYDMDSSIAQQMIEQIKFLKPLAGVFNWWEGRAIRQSIAVAPVCNALHDLAVKHGSHHVFTLHDISQLPPHDMENDGALRKQLNIQGLIVMYVGNLEPYQGIDLLLESFALAREHKSDLHLLVAGGTPKQIKQYEAKAVEFGAGHQTYFLGPWPADRLGQLLAEADILAAPRIKGLNTPLKIFPYLHSGKPVLVTDLPTHSQVLSRDTAMLAPPYPASFASALLQLAGDAELRCRLGEAGRRFVERNHTFPAHQNRVNQLYDFVHKQILATASDALTSAVPANHGGHVSNMPKGPQL